MDWINYTLFTIASDRPVLLIDLLSSIAGLTCVILAGRNSKYNFWVGYLYTALLFILFSSKNLYASMILQPISLAINIMGHYRWTHPKEDQKSSSGSGELKVSMLTWPQRALTVFAVLALAAFWGWFIHRCGTVWFVGSFSPDPIPYLDSCVTMLILVAQYLSALKKWDCWIAWLFVNITQIILHISVGNVFMPIISGIYLVNGIVSIYNWYKLYKKNA